MRRSMMNHQRKKRSVMAKFISVTAIYILVVLLGIGVMMFGWGLKPQSWWWIIGGGVIGRLVIMIMEVVVRSE